MKERPDREVGPLEREVVNTQTTARARILAENHGTASECIGCGEVFCGVAPCDAHRRNATPAERAADAWLTRRCLTAAELTAKGWTRCRLGRWSAIPAPVTGARTPAIPEVGVRA